MCISTHREPTHLGEMLLEEFLVPMNLTQRMLANAIHVPCQCIAEELKSIKTLASYGKGLCQKPTGY